MDPETKKSIDRLIEAVSQSGQKVFQTNREVRNKVELAASEIESLKNEIESAKLEFGSRMGDLSKAIELASTSSSKLSGRMVWLTVILAFAAIVTAASPFLPF